MADKPTATFTPPRDTSTPAEQQARFEQAYWSPRFAQKLAVDDAGRAVAPRVEMVALAGFTITAGEAHAPEDRVIQRGETFEISEYDVPKYAGKAGRKLLDPSTL